MSTETLSAEQLIDALAYVDPAPTGALKDVVDAVVDAEAERGDPVEVYYERIVAEAAAGSAHADSTGGAEGSAMTPAFAASAMLAQEMRRVEAEIPLAALDSERYALPAPAEGASLAEWQAAVDNAKAQAEHQAVRRVNLELLHTFGEKAHRIHAERNTAMAAAATGDAATLDAEIDAVNQARKVEQETAGVKLDRMNRRFFELLNRNSEIEAHCAAIQLELDARSQAAWQQ